MNSSSINSIAARARFGVPVIAGSVWGTVSAFTPMSYDEGLWLAVTRRMDLGARLYSDLIDNKTPPVYWTTRLLDHVPGPFSLARGILFGALIALIAFLAAALARRLGVADRGSLSFGIFVGSLVAMQSALVLNIETPVAIFLLAALGLMARDRLMTGAAVAAIGTAFDVRALAFLPAVIVFAAERGGRRKAWGAAAVWLAAGGTWLATIVAVPRLRYGILELNASTRGTLDSWGTGAVAAIVIVALVPIAVAAILRLHIPRGILETARSTPSGVLLLVTGLAVGIASRFPFLKYWILVAPALPLLFAAARPGETEATSKSTTRARVASAGMVLLAFVPLAVDVSSTQVSEHGLVARYAGAARALERALEPGDTFVSFDPQPFMTTFLPEHASLPWATLDYIGVRTSHRDADLRRLASAIDRAAAVVDDGALSKGERAIDHRFRAVWRVYRERLGRFPCVRRMRDITIRLRADRCR